MWEVELEECRVIDIESFEYPRYLIARRNSWHSISVHFSLTTSQMEEGELAHAEESTISR